MLIIIDHSLPLSIKNRLSKYGDLIEFETTNIVYKAISGHPDIFFCKTPDNLILAPNLPEKYINILKKENIQYIIGSKNLGSFYPETSYYNALITLKYIFHNLKFTDSKILQTQIDKIPINVNQSYTRCNLISLNENNLITSDFGIYKKLSIIKELNVYYIEPSNIVLPGYKNGFFGGCCGIYKNNLFITGSLSHIVNYREVYNFIELNKFNLIELSENKLFDCGSILFLDK